MESLSFPMLMLVMGIILYLFFQSHTGPKVQEVGRIMIFVGLFFITQVMLRM